jgi:mono/diheme cytochrome c family protein
VKRAIPFAALPRAVPAGAVLAALLIPGLIACGQKEDTRTAAQKGRTLYSLHCISCHNPDPAKDGALGPAVAGSGLDLLMARVLRGEYPPGYAPKRSTRIMQKLPLSEADVRSLHAYLNGL